MAGNLGNFFVILSFAASLLAMVSYFFTDKSPSPIVKKVSGISWDRLARISFYVHSFSVVMIVAILFFILFNHYYEYKYVWQHSNNELPMRYIFSCFWEGQEGSFLLWTFWNVTIGNILIRTLSQFTIKWRNSVMTIFSSVQVFLSSMLLGINFGNFHLGSNPFIRNPDNLSLIDGRGLNPLLQNFWMTIHPPVLFLGFALTLVPFCFALAALWKKRYYEWIKPAIPWTFFAMAILGAGILMGGAWAYEALSFGGFWAWDPVENSSLVPWITLVGAGHIMLVRNKKGSPSVLLFFLPLVSFLLILYSTFLTRSGILSESSVHAFTDLGMSGQLLIFFLFYLILAFSFFFIRFKEMSERQEEEAIWTREFWIFIVNLVLLVSVFQIISTTSIPVLNKIMGTKLAPPVESIAHYNGWQVPISIILALILGISPHLTYVSARVLGKKIFKQISLSFFISLIFTILFAYFLEMFKSENIIYLILLFSSLFAFFSNVEYFIRIFNGKFYKAGASLAHAGFGLILVGALISQSQQKNISSNVSGVDKTHIGKLNTQENILLTINDTIPMTNYFVSYKGKNTTGVNVIYEVEYLIKNDLGNYEKQFSLYPRIQSNSRMGNISEPDTKHFLDKDIYTHVAYAKTGEIKNESKDFIILKAIVFPFINILWVGCVLFFIGTLLSVFQRMKPMVKK